MPGTSLRTHLAGLLAVALVPVLAFGAYLGVLALRKEQAAVKRGLKETARALSLATDRKVAELASVVLTGNRHTIRAANAAEALEQCGRPGGISVVSLHAPR